MPRNAQTNWSDTQEKRQETEKRPHHFLSSKFKFDYNNGIIHACLNEDKHMNMTETRRLTLDFWSRRLQSLYKQKSRHWISAIWVISTTLVYGRIIEYGSSSYLIFRSSMFNPWKERGNVTHWKDILLVLYQFWTKNLRIKRNTTV